MGSAFAGDKLKKLRQDMGWSQVDLADRIGVSGSVVSMYENGQREPARDTLAKIARELNISMDALVLHDDSGHVAASINPLRDKDVDFGFMVSRSKNNSKYSVTLYFDGFKPVLSVNGSDGDFVSLYSKLQPEDKIAVCKAMLDRAKDELIRG